MKPEVDVLITKYLDGDLTPSEDTQLRTLLSEAPEAKSAFDQAVALHLAMRNDAEATRLPQDLAVATEEMLLMKILSDSGIPPVISVRSKSRSGVTALLMLIAILIPVFTSSVGNKSGGLAMGSNTSDRALLLATNDSPGGGSETAAEQYSEPVAANGTPAYPVISSAVAAAESCAPAEAPANNAGNNPKGSEAARTSLVHTLADVGEYHTLGAVFADTDNTANTLYNGNDAGAEHPARTDGLLTFAEFLGGNTLDAAAEKQSDARFAGTDEGFLDFVETESNGDNKERGHIYLSTSMGTDIISSAEAGKSTPTLSLISQSLAYSLNGRSRIGLEIGYMNFNYATYNQLSQYAAMAHSGNPSSGGRPHEKDREKDNKGNGDEEPDSPIKGHKNYAIILSPPEDGEGVPERENNTTFTLERTIVNKSTVWGALFYEHSIPLREKISFVGRLGLGGSNDGMIAYLRGGGDYAFNNTLSLSLGFDTRAMMLRVFEHKSSSKLDFGLSFVAGLNWKF